MKPFINNIEENILDQTFNRTVKFDDINLYFH